MSIFNDKALKSVAEIAAKIMQNEELKGDQHKIDANKNGKVDAHDFLIVIVGLSINCRMIKGWLIWMWREASIYDEV